jgi:hypothetical protein
VSGGQPSMRSLYSRSVTKTLSGASPKSVRELTRLYDGLEKELGKASVADGYLEAALEKGRTITELVFENAVVDLGKKTNAGFSLTLWYAADGPALHRRSSPSCRIDTKRREVMCQVRSPGVPCCCSRNCRHGSENGEARITRQKPRLACRIAIEAAYGRALWQKTFLSSLMGPDRPAALPSTKIARTSRSFIGRRGAALIRASRSRSMIRA